MKRFQKTFIVLFCAALMCMGVCSAAAELDLASYLSVSYSGTNGSGVARAGFDFAGLEYDIMSAWESDEQLEKLAGLTAVEMTILPEPACVENLSNGDHFTVRISFDSRLAEENGYEFAASEKTFTVDGLAEVVEIDPFAGDIFGADRKVSISAEGVDPFLVLNLHNNADFSDPVSHIRYHADKDYMFRNDEEITISAQLDNVYAKQGYALSRTETTVSFNGMDRYVNASQDLTEEALRRICDRAYQECVNGGNANIFDSGNSYSPWAVEFTDIRVGENALLAVNNNIEMEYSFLLVPVYKTISTDEWYDMDAGTNVSMRWEDVVGYYKFTDLIVHGDGSLSFNEDYVEMNGNYASADAAALLYLDQYRTNYSFTEIPLPLEPISE